MVSVAEVLRTSVDLKVLNCPAPQASVRWVATNEMAEPSPFLEGGELLLCTGLPTADWDEERWARYVRELTIARISALGFATGPTLTHAVMPAGLVKACESLGMNLLEVPMVTSFVAVSQAVAELLEDRDRVTAKEAAALQRRLAQAARRKDAAGAIATELASYLRGKVWAVAPDASLLAVSGQLTGDESLLDQIRRHVDELRPRGLGASSSWVSGAAHVALQPVGLQEPPQAYLAVATAGPMSDYARTATQTSLSLLSLELERRFERQESARRLSRQAFDLLLEGEARASELVLSAASPDRADVRLPRPAKILRVLGDRDALRSSLNEAERFGAKRWVLAALTPDGRELQLMTSATDSADLAQLLTRPGLRIGIGSPVSASDVGRGLRSAGFALDEATAARPLVTWEDMTDSGVTALISAEAREAFADDLLARLETTGTGREELVRVANSYIRHHGRVHSVAAEMDVHRNTVRARVREIESALGYDLDDPTARLSLWVALQTERRRQI